MKNILLLAFATARSAHLVYNAGARKMSGELVSGIFNGFTPHAFHDLLSLRHAAHR